MPPLQSYNPILLGFVEGKGAIHLPLKAAQDAYGQLPSDYGLLPATDRRRARRVLNLPVGMAIIDLLREGAKLREVIGTFYERWGRDFHADFRVHLEPFHRLNTPWDVWQVIDENRELLAEQLAIEASEYLRVRGLVSLATLRSIPATQLLVKAKTMLAKKLRNPAHGGEREAIQEALAFLSAKALLNALSAILGGDISRWGREQLACYADEVARILWDLSRHLRLRGVDRLTSVRGRDVEVEFASREASFLALGKEVGDCTADKPFRQVDRDVENIYWTVFSWFLDRQYQILKVFYAGQFVMKAHLLPLLATGPDGGQIFLAVDAVETTPVFREDTRLGQPDLLERKEYIFTQTVRQIARIAESMGIEHVYAERFSNTAWVRRELERFPEVYLHIGTIQKIDELEDVFEFSKRLCAVAKRERPRSIFMELQMKNTFLLPGAATVRGVKAFAVLAGDARLGMPMKRVYGV
jgi:hypothetical protein